jgi:signal transduction histidine kinase
MGNHDAVKARARTGAASDRVAPRNGSRPARPWLTTLSNWPVSRRLFAVIALALVMGLVFGGLEVASAESSATQFGRVLQLAKLGQQDVILTQDLQNERDSTLGLTDGGGTGNLAALHDATNAEAAKVLALAAGVDGSYPANIQATVAALRSGLGGSLTSLQDAVETQFWDRSPGSAVDGLSVINEYAPLINTLITLNDELAQGTSDASLAIDVRELNLLSLAKDQSSQQRGLFFNAFTQQFFSNLELQALISARSAEQSDETAFLSAATPAEQHTFNTTVAGTGVKEVKQVEEFFFDDGDDQQANPFLSPQINAENVGFTVAQAPAAWYGASSEKLDEMQTVELGIAQDTVARAQSIQQGAGESALLISVSVVVVLLIVLIAALVVARSLAVPLRRLRAAALDIATAQLPERMRRLSEAPDDVADLQVAPIDVLTSDEIGEVARAFDQVHAEAVRLAANEAVLRTSLNAMFVNLSRRSQALIERVARTIDSLEQDEDDPDRLSSLFSIDHMVTRMRRNSENLLLLAGHEGARKWSDPVSVADVARAATSEIEHYSRVVLNIQPGVAVIGSAVSDIVHLLAELIENATLYSPTDTTVRVSGHELPSGGVLIEITDKGIGIPEERLAEMNWRLQSTPAIDVSVSRHMGLFAVARLAERHNVQVRLRPASSQGLNALVWLPDSVIERTALPFTGRRAPQAVQGGAGGAGGAGSAGGAGTLDRRAPGQHGITRLTADGQPGNLHEDTRGGLVSAGQERVDWFHRRDRALGGEPTDTGRGDQTSTGLPARVPKSNPLHGPADGRAPEDAEQLPWPVPEMTSGGQRGSHRAPGGQRPGEGPAVGDG